MIDDVNDVNMLSLPNKTPTSVSQNKGNSRTQLDLLHDRLGHPSLSKMKHIDVDNCKGITEYNCGVCYSSKHHKLPFTSCFDLIHLDLRGPYRVRALDGASYFLTILDDNSRVTWTFLLHNKLQVEKIIKDFLAMVETQFQMKVKRVRSDNGTEVVKDLAKDYLMIKVFSMKSVFHMFLNKMVE